MPDVNMQGSCPIFATPTSPKRTQNKKLKTFLNFKKREI